ncbi:MAG: pentapeptide repeat-containing protein [Mastigocoleus sp.]
MSRKLFFAKLGYRIIEELGSNREAGRITYLAEDEDLEEKVVIKEFCFTPKKIAKCSSSEWSNFFSVQTAIDREINILQQLSHPRIPGYLTSFTTNQGFCLVQEYKKAPSLAQRYSFTLREIKQISVSILENLVYLQNKFPAIIHRDIKPENILIDEQLNAYLIDFGLARLSSKDLSVNSMVAGTLGFMPPEEYFGHSPTEASDLYSLGATLICLLSGTRSVDIGQLVNEEYRFDIERLKPKISSDFALWLSKMVEPNLKNRFPNAAIALEELKCVSVVDTEESILNKRLNKRLNKTNNYHKSLLSLGSVSLSTLIILGIIGINVLKLNGFNFKSNSEFGSKLSTWESQNYLGIESDKKIKKNKNTEENEQQRQKPEFLQLLKTKNCWSCNLNKISLVLANLENANLENSSLIKADLEGINLQNANLKNSLLEESNLERANLKYVNLNGSSLEKVELQNANLQEAKLASINLRNANILDANFKKTTLNNSDLRNVYAVGANFQDANLHNVNLAGAKLQNANLRNANLEGVNLSNANLRGANLRGANLKDANLEGAILIDVDLKEVNSKSDQFFLP